MRRTVLIAPLLLALAGPGPAGAVAPAAPTLGVRVASCETGLTADEREAAFTAAMPALDGATGLAMRFDLEQRRGGGLWRTVTVPGFGRWERSAMGAAGFVYTKRVERLAPAASYRVAVRLRWTAADGSTVRRVTRRSASCRQPDGRPQLSVAAIAVGQPLGDGRARYVVRVRNAGPGVAPASARIGLRVDGVALPAAPLGARLAVGTVSDVVFEGPVCAPGGLVEATADPEDDLEEPREGDNALALRCAS